MSGFEDLTDDFSVAAWAAGLLISDSGRQLLSELKAYVESGGRILGTSHRTSASPTDFAVSLKMPSMASVLDVLERPEDHGLAKDSIFVGGYLPAPKPNAFAVHFYSVGVNVVSVRVIGRPNEDAAATNAIANAAKLLGPKNQVNFLPDGNARSNRAFVHNELVGAAPVDPATGRHPITRSEVATVALAAILWPTTVSANFSAFAHSLFGRPYGYVETDQPAGTWPAQLPDGTAPLRVASNPPRPVLGFVVQLPPTPTGGGSPPPPVCVMSPCHNNHPTRDPDGTDSIYMLPDQIVLKVY